MRVVWVILAVLASVFAPGCGRIAFDELAPDAPVEDTSCWPLWRTGVMLEPPERRGDLNTNSLDKNPWLTPDGLEMYFASNRDGGQGFLDFWYADRPSTDARFEVRGPIAELSGSVDEGRLELDRTGLVAVLSTNSLLGSGQPYNTYIATRPDTSSPFTIRPELTADLNTASDDKDPHFLAGGTLTLYYTTSNTFRVTRRASEDAPFPPSTEVLLDAELPLRADPQLSPDELTLVFSGGSSGALDFYVATRDDVDAPFANPVPLTALNTPALERDLTITADGCEAWFARAAPDDDIWMSRVIRE